MARKICLFHRGCRDGVAAAWAVTKALGKDIELIGVNYGDKEIPDLHGADVLIVDFSYKRQQLLDLTDKANSILVLDHHKTARAELDGLGVDLMEMDWPVSLDELYKDAPEHALWTAFDMDRSGATMAWDFFFGGRRPKLIDYVQDRDLWKFHLPHSKAISAWLSSFPTEVHEFGQRISTLEHDFESLIRQGYAILQKQETDINNLLEMLTETMVIGGYSVPVANIPPTMASEAAGQLAQGHPFAAVYCDGPQGRVFSLRRRDSDVDVSEIAQSYGGGGHAAAAGFSVPHGWRGDE